MLEGLNVRGRLRRAHLLSLSFISQFISQLVVSSRRRRNPDDLVQSCSPDPVHVDGDHQFSNYKF